MTVQTKRGVACLICASPARPYCRKDSARYYGCQACNTLFQHPMPAADVMAKYVDEEYATGAYQDYVRARNLKMLTFRSRARQILARSGRGRLLDVGAACGYFVEAALEVGYDAYGLEISPVAISAAVETVRPRMKQGDVNHLVGQQETPFDVMTAFDIIEHVFDPMAFLESLTPLIRPGGLLVLTTPDTGHALRYVMRKHWPMLQPLQHTVLFSRRSLEDALRGVGFTSVSIVPARKVLTADYLAGQVGTLSPAVDQVYQLGSRVIPTAIRQRPVGVNIGELMAFATWPGR